ncbi:MAG: hypothetical protein ACSW8B_01610 [bacterium]
MGLFGPSYGELEQIQITIEGEAKVKALRLASIPEEFDCRYLKRVAKESHIDEVRWAAQNRLDLLQSKSRRERKQMQRDLQAQKEKAKQAGKQFEQAAQDQNRPEYYLKKLYEWYARENNVGRSHIEEGLLSYGDTMYPYVRDYLFTLARQYQDYTSGIYEIRFGTPEGQKFIAIREAYVNGMSYGILFLAKFTHPQRASAINEFYDYIYHHIFSDPVGGFSDHFHAIQIRQYSVRAMANATSDRKVLRAFYIKILQDPCHFVRWEAIDELHRHWTPAELQNDSALEQALKEAYAKEDNGVSNRKAKCRELLGIQD